MGDNNTETKWNTGLTYHIAWTAVLKKPTRFKKAINLHRDGLNK